MNEVRVRLEHYGGLAAQSPLRAGDLWLGQALFLVVKDQGEVKRPCWPLEELLTPVDLTG